MEVNNIVDYFFVCGLDLQIGLDAYLPDDPENDCQSRPPLEQPYKCRLLQHFPEHSPRGVFEVDAVATMCMPHGLHLCTQKTITGPVNHSFIITREDGTRLFGIALLFYEEVLHSEVTHAVIALQNMFEIENNPHCEGGKSYDAPHMFSKESDRLYAMKAIGVLTRYPLFFALDGWLYDLWCCLQVQEPPPLPLESYVYNLLYEVPLPPQGKAIGFQGIYTTHYCRRPGTSELPLFEYSLYRLLKTLGLKSLIRLYTCTLLEFRIVLFAQDYRHLMLVAEGVSCLLFPFSWPHVYVPILPLSAMHFLDAPVPFIMGIKISQPSESEIQLASEANVCYVNIDEGTVTTTDDIPYFPDADHLCDELETVLIDYERSATKLQDIVSPSLPNTKNEKADLDAASVLSTNQNSREGADLSKINRFGTERNPSIDSDSGLNINVPDNRVEMIAMSHSTPLPLTSSSLNNSTINETFDKESALSNKMNMISFDDLPSLREKSSNFNPDSTDSALKSSSNNSAINTDMRLYTEMLKFNNSVREIFLNHFIHIFFDYEAFLIRTKASDMSNYLAKKNKEALITFGKAEFLMEQSERHLPFLSAFLETQMFTNFVDMKILSTWEEPDASLLIFHQRLTQKHHELKTKREKKFEDKSFAYQPCTKFNPEFNVMIDRLLEPDTLQIILKPHPLDLTLPCWMVSNRGSSVESSLTISHHHVIGHFPPLRCELLRPQNNRSCNPAIETADSSSEKIQETAQTSNTMGGNSTALPPTGDSRSLSNRQGNLGRSRRQRLGTPNLRSGTDKEKYMHATRLQTRQPNLSDMAPSGMAQTNWRFVDTLLQECKTKTKRMVVDKMGPEAIELGHADLSVCGVEENTLVNGLCDLLERIWSHGLSFKEGKSALWIHLIKYCDKYTTSKSPGQERRKLSISSSTSQPEESPNRYIKQVKEALTSLNVDTYSIFRFLYENSPESGHYDVFSSLKRSQRMTSSPNNSPSLSGKGAARHATGSLSRRSSSTHKTSGIHSGAASPSPATTMHRGISASAWPGIDLGEIFGPARRSLAADIHAVRRMNEVKSDVGYARAFVRLALEKKMLANHLKKLLTDKNLLHLLYKRYAFLRCEEEREQFLFHLLALNAVDYFSFTNVFYHTVIKYRVFVSTGKKYSGCNTTANPWFCLTGQHTSTGVMTIPRKLLSFEFQHSNLGVLTTLRIGHDNAGVSPKWFIELILVQNTVTGHIYKFPCNRWLGKTVDDGSTERLLVGELLKMTEEDAYVCSESNLNNSGYQTPPRTRSPSIGRRFNDPRNLNISTIQEQLGNAVNNLVKHYLKPDKERSSLTLILVGEKGLVPSMGLLFNYGFKSGRIFQKKVYIWDFLERVNAHIISEWDQIDPADPSLPAITGLCRNISKISQASHSIGKDGKFHRWICIGLKDHCLSDWLCLLATNPITAQFYDDRTFLRDDQLRTYVINILDSLNDFEITLEQSLISDIAPGSRPATDQRF